VVPVQLRDQWGEICRAEPERCLAVLDQIIAAYSGPTRQYHGLAHVIGVVERVNELAQEDLWSDPIQAAEDAEIAVLAAWFHDVVYDSLRGDNEAASAAQARRDLTLLELDAQRVEQVAQLVEMTAHHHPTDRAGALVADADLWTLGGEPAEYFAYGSLIRAEYAHVPDDLWVLGRGRFIRSFLARPHIFTTPRGRSEREPQARHNLETELALLG
jgi:predicted metal-dependent HD superfamily phosphohydrolase